MPLVSPAGIYRLWMGPIPYVVLTRGVSAEAVLSRIQYIEKGYEYDHLQPWLGTGLLTSKGEKWHIRRKLLTPAFHFEILEDFVEIFYEQSLILVEKLSNHADGQDFNICPYITKYTLDIICETAMGEKVNAQTRLDSEFDYVRAVCSVSEITFDRIVKPAFLIDILFYTLGPGRQYRKDLKILHDFTDIMIMKKKAGIDEVQRNSVLANSKRPRMAFLDSLLQARTEDGHELDNASIREEVDTFMFEGHDTTSAAAGFAVYLLGAHPEIQAKTREEVDNVFGRTHRLPSQEDLKNLPYLEMVIKETLRLFPSVPFVSRKANEDIYIGQKFALMEEKAILSTLLRNYLIESVVPMEEFAVQGQLVTRPANGVQVRLTSRR